MKIAIEIAPEDVAWLRWHLGRVLTLGRIGFVEPTRGDNILARVFDAHVAECARRGPDDGCGMGGAMRE